MTLLMDYNRSTRSNETNGIKCSTKSILLPLSRNGANVAFYLTPHMSGWRKYSVFNREKWNELVSLHHIKCYIFDDNIIISGANLSDTYFTNRQDRYILFRNCKELCDYFDELVRTISTFSMQLNPNGDFSLHHSWTYDPLNYFHRNQFKIEAKKRIDKLNDSFRNKFDTTNSNTIAFPLLQFKTLDISDDEHFTSHLLENCSSTADIRLASGYFNLTKRYKQIILNRKSVKTFNILMASERANGFYGAKGVTAYIPYVYTHLTKVFLRQVKSKQSNITLYAYNRPNWTFHAKGLWLSLNSKYMLTMIGSPNFGYRSVYRDSEAQVVLLTTDENLKYKLKAECNDLWHYSYLINSDTDLVRVPFWVSLVAKFMKKYF
jgi:CDP-diacylglycerol--glycerol-3-phosphate 3-phosphatidyltransferase